MIILPPFLCSIIIIIIGIVPILRNCSTLEALVEEDL